MYRVFILALLGLFSCSPANQNNQKEMNQSFWLLQPFLTGNAECATARRLTQQTTSSRIFPLDNKSIRQITPNVPAHVYSYTVGEGYYILGLSYTGALNGKLTICDADFYFKAKIDDFPPGKEEIYLGYLEENKGPINDKGERIKLFQSLYITVEGLEGSDPAQYFLHAMQESNIRSQGFGLERGSCTTNEGCFDYHDVFDRPTNDCSKNRNGTYTAKTRCAQGFPELCYSYTNEGPIRFTGNTSRFTDTDSMQAYCSLIFGKNRFFYLKQ